MPTTIGYFLLSGGVWVAILVIPPGSKSVESSYRLNFAQGVVCSLLAIASLHGLLPEDLTIMACTSYFVVDTANKLVNDLCFKVESYQRGIVRVVEYVHHFLSITVAVYSQLYYKDVCNCSSNPVLRIALAELSTPFLVAWRQTGYDWLGGLFILVFFAVRIVYQGFFLIPEIVRECSSHLVKGFSVLYLLLNAWFMVMIVKKALRPKRTPVDNTKHE